MVVIMDGITGGICFPRNQLSGFTHILSTGENSKTLPERSFCKALETGATNNEAEYRGLNRGLDAALKKGYTHTKVYGDSELVVKQTQGEWKVRHPRMAEQWNHMKELKSRVFPGSTTLKLIAMQITGPFLQDGQFPGKKH